ncbi:hypothetical protein [Streptomyces sp. GS7]|uniref:hypothetical protein n=1 Tax=Streptomyces sp. GS7 TaxID=2692234 RepID=UPI0013184B7E|nr:hypothetical protein [Streptomyces sp. GS7]QHC23323.1 hypothetical protein GR130_19925 [Streptomyces sp. GS7]
MTKFKTLSRRAAGTALALVALVAPAAAPAVAAGQPPREGTYCTPWSEFYGHGRYTFADARVCLRTTSFGLTQVWLQTDRVTFWARGVWNNASNREGFRAKVSAHVEVRKDGKWLYNEWARGTQEQRKDEFHGGDFKQGECGTYWVTYKYHQVGPHYGGDKAINPSWWHGSQVEVPCAS